MPFSVTILGSGSAVPTGRRNPTSQLVVCKSRHILIDCAEGTQMQMRKFGVKFQRINFILISHLHGDHYFGLIGLLNTMHLLGRVQDLKIFAPIELKEIIKVQQDAGRGGFGFKIDFIPISPDEPGLIFEDEKIRVSTIPLVHKIPTCGFVIEEKIGDRILDAEKASQANIPVAYYSKLKKSENVILDNGDVIQFELFTKPPSAIRKYAFCSDTAYSENIIPYISGVDLLYHEATFTEKFKERAVATKHSTAIEAALIAKKASVKKLLIGHLSARFESGEIHLKEAKEVFENTIVVEDGDKYLI